MNPNLTQKDVDAVYEFFAKMDSDMADFREMYRTEDNLAKAVQEYERVWKVKIKVVYEPPNAS